MGRFRKGVSGNPAGRPRGTGEAAKLRAAIQNDLPEIIASLVQAARAGDVAAARLLLDRTLPALRPESMPVALPELGVGTLVQRAEAAIAAAGNGELAPDTAATLVAAIGGLAKLQELSELVARIEKLEESRDGHARN